MQSEYLSLILYYVVYYNIGLYLNCVIKMQIPPFQEKVQFVY